MAVDDPGARQATAAQAGMPGFRRVVVGTDEADATAGAVAWAATLAQGHGAALEVVEAYQLQAEHTPEDRNRRESRVRNDVAAWTAHHALVRPADVLVCDGDPGSVLVEVAERERADVLVVGSHEVEGSTRLALGSTVRSLVRNAPCPVVAVPPQGGSEVPASGGIVVGVDGSPGSEAALDWAEMAAAPLHLPVYAVYAVDDVYGTFSAQGDLGPDEQAAGREVRREQRRLRHDGDRQVEFVERMGSSPAAVLAAEAADRHASMIVVAVRERHNLGGRIVGDVVDDLIHEPPCAVAVLPKPYLDRVEGRIG